MNTEYKTGNPFITGLWINGMMILPPHPIKRRPMTEDHKRKISESVKRAKSRNITLVEHK